MSSGRRTRPPAAKYSCIADDVKLGKGVKIFAFVNLYGCEIGDGSRIGAYVEIQKNVKIGKRCKISVTRDVPPHTVVAGNPATVLRTVSPASSAARIQR